MNTTDEGFSFSFHKNYKLGPTYPRYAIFSLRELHQTSPSALRAETSSRYQSNPPENQIWQTDEAGASLAVKRCKRIRVSFAQDSLKLQNKNYKRLVFEQAKDPVIQWLSCTELFRWTNHPCKSQHWSEMCILEELKHLNQCKFIVNYGYFKRNI